MCSEMKTSCLHTTLLPLFLFLNTLHVTALGEPCECKDNHPVIRRVAVHGNVSITCPGLTAHEMKFTLFKGTTEVNSYTHMKDKNATTVWNNMGKNVTLRLNPEENTTSLVIYDVTTEHQGLYTCVAENIYPPPHSKIKEKPQTFVIVEEAPSQQIVPQCESSDESLPLWAGLVVLAVYGLIVTMLALLFRARLRAANAAAHDYMNVKPRTRRRNQGILLPTRLSWYSDTPTSIASCNKLSYKRTSNYT